MQVRIALDVPEDHSYIRMIRRVGRALLEHHQAAAQDIEDIETVMGELCANVTRHARSEAGRYRIALEHHGDHVVLVVTDGGPGFDPQGLPAVGAERPDAGDSVRHGGYGLPLVGALMDGLEFQRAQPQGTTVRTHKRLRASDAAG